MDRAYRSIGERHVVEIKDKLDQARRILDLLR
jgi:hypothetical protein